MGLLIGLAGSSERRLTFSMDCWMGARNGAGRFLWSLLDGPFDWVGGELGMVLDVLDGLLDGPFDSVGWVLGLAPDVFEGLLDGPFDWVGW